MQNSSYFMLGVGSNEWSACLKWNILPKSDIPACQGNDTNPKRLLQSFAKSAAFAQTTLIFDITFRS